MTWAEDRAPWQHVSSADPGTKDRRGAARCHPVFAFGIGTNAVTHDRVVVCSEVFISEPRFVHFTLNHYISWFSSLPPAFVRKGGDVGSLVSCGLHCPRVATRGKAKAPKTEKGGAILVEATANTWADAGGASTNGIP